MGTSKYKVLASFPREEGEGEVPSIPPDVRARIREWFNPVLFPLTFATGGAASALTCSFTSHLCHQTTSAENWAAGKCTIPTLKSLIRLLRKKTERSVWWCWGRRVDGEIGTAQLDSLPCVGQRSLR